MSGLVLDVYGITVVTADLLFERLVSAKQVAYAL